MGIATPRIVADDRVEQLREALSRVGFSGDFEAGLGARTVAATDNSIYQVVPAAIAYPACGEDINRLVRGIAQSDTPLSLTARGGNTGTNGQSLNGGIIVDFSRHMNRILALDVEAGTVTVEPGVVLGQLNAALSGHGLFFPPSISTASRATIGGMVATDASGKGSRRYGKTSDHVVALDLVLADGSDWQARAMTRHEAERIAAGSGLVADIHREVLGVVTDHADAIAETFPEMNRGLTGYNLQQTWNEATDRFDLGYLLAGSEGTLALTKAITLRVARKPTHRALAVLRYDSFDAALRDVTRLLEADPLAVEILDDKVLGVARDDIVWAGLEAALGGATERPVRALNFVEYVGFDDRELGAGLARFTALDGAAPAALIDCLVVRDAAIVAQLWSLREKSVGLLARLGGGRQGMAFVEDTAVPPAHLADFIAEFRALLDAHDVRYGMFGHADVGCLHVRPLLDMKVAAEAALVRPISDAVAALVKRYGGLLWGEHGRGYRGEFSPLFFGPELYPALGRIKRAFDPRNLFNPGKLAVPEIGGRVDRIDDVPFRGTRDGRIDRDYLAEFDRAVACNGNGACFSWDAFDAMCPSYKATRDRAQSPKGRAALLRAWAMLSSIAEPGPREAEELTMVEEAAERSLSTCLSCKACTTLCPVKVDVPTMKSRFLARRYAGRRRPARHQLLARMEAMLRVGRAVPALANLVAGSPLAITLLGRLFGLADLPRFATEARRDLPPVARIATLRALAAADRARTVVLVEDGFTASFDGGVVAAAGQVLHALGFLVFRVPPRPNGKVLYVLGLRTRFEQVARARVAECKALSATGVRLVGLDAATALLFEQEYREFTATELRVEGLEEVLASAPQAGFSPSGGDGRSYRLFLHCTEQALRPQAGDRWIAALARFGLDADIVRTGCCGMAGLFGHEAEHAAMSKRLYDLSWRDAIAADPDAVLATGYSCRSQVRRFDGRRPRHPIELLHALLSGQVS